MSCNCIKNFELAPGKPFLKSRRPWKSHWKTDSASFRTISPFSEVVLLLKRRGFRLKLKRGGSAGVRIEMVEFIALPFSSSKKLKIWSFHVVQTAKKCTKRRDARAVIFLTKLLLFDVAVAVAFVVSKGPSYPPCNPSRYAGYPRRA